MDGTLAWLLDSPAHRVSLSRGPEDPVQRDADPDELRAVRPCAELLPELRRPRRPARAGMTRMRPGGRGAAGARGTPGIGAARVAAPPVTTGRAPARTR